MLDNIKNCKIVSFVGLAKNVGKTTALNYFLRQLPKTAVTSVGVDGEFDECAVDGTKKPRIYLQSGSLFTTTEQSIQKNNLSVSIIEKTDILTPLGHIVLAEAKISGFYEIYRAGSLEDTREIAEKFLRRGAERVFIDGALFRMSHAGISSGCILVSGSNVNAKAEDVVEETKKAVEYLNFEKSGLEKRKNPYVVDDAEINEIDFCSVLNNEKKVMERITETTTHIYMPGAFTSHTFENFRKMGFRFDKITIVLDNGTRCLLKRDEYAQFRKMNGKIEVLDKINLCGIVVNSASTFLGNFDPGKFIEKLRSELSQFKVEDVLLCS